MRPWILFVIALSLSVLGRAQERTAVVRLEDGTKLSGRVVSMDLKQLRLVIDEKIVTIEAADIKSCHFEGGEVPAEGKPAEGQPGAAQPGETNPGEAQPGGETRPGATSPATQPGGAPADPANVAAPGPAANPPSSAGASTTAADPGAHSATTAPDPTLSVAPVAGPKTRLQARMAVVEEFYPWLRPVDPTQWLSIGLLLISALSLIVHISVVVAGAENAPFGRSLGLAVLYIIAGVGQLALVPGNDFGVFSMLIGNTALVLFAVSCLFKLARSSAFVAFAVQVGFVVVSFGVLQLVDSLLGSVAAS